MQDISSIELLQQKNIAEHNDVLKKLGLPTVSKRKFSRHVPNFKSLSDESSSDESSSEDDGNSENSLVDGEEVYLLKEGK